MSGSDVRFTTRDGETFDGYLTGPDDGVPAPGILLVTAVFGVDQEMRELADAWAADGFLVSVPDIFWRQIPGYHPAVAKESRERVLRCFRTM
jgi:carboxymethylenebutenolidase